jgi:hypothetical protein
MVPVNLRGKVVRNSDVENHSSYVGVKIESFESVRDVHQKIYSALASGEHWANWYGYKSGRFLSARLRRMLLSNELATSQWNIGAFSNLGDWDPEKKLAIRECEGTWLFCPPVLRCQQVGAGCLTFQNCLSLTIQVHPELTTSSEVPRVWMQNWIKEVELDLGGVVTERIAHCLVA